MGNNIENQRTKLNKYDIITNRPKENLDYKSRVEQIDFAIFSTPRNKLYDIVEYEKLINTNYNTNRQYKTLMLEGSRVENISKLLEVNNNHISGASAATSSDSFNRNSKKLVPNNINNN